jgi:creatinine amidohydrolase
VSESAVSGVSGADDVRWSSMTSAAVAEFGGSDTLVIVPVGSIEQHGPHLRLHEDIANALALAESAAQASPHPVMVAPPVWWGMAPHHMGFAGTISLRLETFSALIADICTSLAEHGFRRILLLNGHGGNAAALVATATQLSADHGLFVSSVSYWMLIPDVLADVGTSAQGGMGHAGEMETSIALHLRPDTVLTDRLEADIPVTASGSRAIDFRAPGAVSVPLDLRRDSKAGVIGDPTVATADKGATIVAALVDRLVGVIDDLISAPTGR